MPFQNRLASCFSHTPWSHVNTVQKAKIYHADLAIKHQWFIGGGDDTLRGHEHLDHGDVRGQ